MSKEVPSSNRSGEGVREVPTPKQAGTGSAAQVRPTVPRRQVLARPSVPQAKAPPPQTLDRNVAGPSVSQAKAPPPQTLDRNVAGPSVSQAERPPQTHPQPKGLRRMVDARPSVSQAEPQTHPQPTGVRRKVNAGPSVPQAEPPPQTHPQPTGLKRIVDAGPSVSEAELPPQTHPQPTGLKRKVSQAGQARPPPAGKAALRPKSAPPPVPSVTPTKSVAKHAPAVPSPESSSSEKDPGQKKQRLLVQKSLFETQLPPKMVPFAESTEPEPRQSAKQTARKSQPTVPRCELSSARASGPSLGVKCDHEHEPERACGSRIKRSLGDEAVRLVQLLMNTLNATAFIR